MHKAIKVQIGSLKPSERIRLLEVIEALDKGLCEVAKFDNDGSGVVFTYTNLTGNHGKPCLMSCSFSMETAMLILAGNSFEPRKFHKF